MAPSVSANAMSPAPGAAAPDAESMGVA